MKRLQETETPPVAYNTALRKTVTWMTEKFHQDLIRAVFLAACCGVRLSHIGQKCSNTACKYPVFQIES